MIAVVVAALFLSGCGILPRHAVPVDQMATAVIPGMPDVRAPWGRVSDAMTKDLARSFQQESPTDFPVGPDGYIHYPHLALSGGGANGAFGAGLLNGWSKMGTRPTFKIVTGVSTGALMAPYAFLGPPYDVTLREFYTTTASRQIFQMLSIIPQLLGGESLADTGPLRATLEQTVDAAFLQAIARAHESGRRLYIGTVDLDSQRFIVWNMGLIATSGHPGAVQLFRNVMLASASVPIAFPPVFFDVETEGGRRYDEMHVDGAVAANLFYSGGVFNFAATRATTGAARGARTSTSSTMDNSRPCRERRRGRCAALPRARSNWRPGRPRWATCSESGQWRSGMARDSTGSPFPKVSSCPATKLSTRW